MRLAGDRNWSLDWEERKWQPTPVFLPGKSREQRSLAGYSLYGCKELDMNERLNNRYDQRGLLRIKKDTPVTQEILRLLGALYPKLGMKTKYIFVSTICQCLCPDPCLISELQLPTPPPATSDVSYWQLLAGNCPQLRTISSSKVTDGCLPGGSQLSVTWLMKAGQSGSEGPSQL